MPATATGEVSPALSNISVFTSGTTFTHSFFTVCSLFNIGDGVSSSGELSAGMVGDVLRRDDTLEDDSDESTDPESGEFGEDFVAVL
jgi:hypothetical protein